MSGAKIVEIKQLQRPAATMLDLARALADYMIADGREMQALTYEETLQVALTLKELVGARVEERRQCAHVC